MQNVQNTTISLPSPSRWGLSTEIAGRPVVRGVFTIDSVTGNMIKGTANFRGTPLLIQGYWDETSKQLRFETPYSSFTGQLQIFDDATIRVRHFILSGQFLMKPPSVNAGKVGNWIATTNNVLTGPPKYTTTGLPPVGVFLTSDLLLQTPRRF